MMQLANPLNYYNSNSYAFTWELGRKLTGASVNGNTLAFTYDDNGIRTSKTVNGVEHIYNVSGSVIQLMPQILLILIGLKRIYRAILLQYTMQAERN